MTIEPTDVDTVAIRQRLDQAIADALPVAGGRVLPALRALRRELDRTDNQRAATADRLADPFGNGAAAGQDFPVLFAHRQEPEEESFPIRSSLIAVHPSKALSASGEPRYARAAGHPDGGDWVRLTRTDGQVYEGYRDSSCPGDGVVGHAHTVHCVRTRS